MPSPLKGLESGIANKENAGYPLKPWAWTSTKKRLSAKPDDCLAQREEPVFWHWAQKQQDGLSCETWIYKILL